jgi:hypothetical protein
MNYLKEYNILKLQNGGNIGEEIRTFLHLWRFIMPIFQQKNKQKFDKHKKLCFYVY